MSRSKTTLRVLRGVSGEWRSPTMWTGSSSSRLRMVATTGLNRSTKPHIRGTPRRSAQATSALLVSRSGVTGFSTRIGLPSSSNTRAACAWNAVGVAMTAASHPVAASRSSAKVQPSRSASGRTRSGSVSMMTARSAPSDSAMTRAWLAPIAPAPTSAMRARAPIGAVSAGRTSQIVNSQVRFDSAARSQQGEEQRSHHRRGRDRAAEQPELDTQEERRAEGGHDEEHDRTGRPPDRDPAVPGERDQDVAEDLGEDEADGARREQREVEVAELEAVTEEDAGHRRTEEREPGDGDPSDTGHEQEKAVQQGLELLVPAAGGQRGELGQERRLDRLEEKDRDVGDDAAQLKSARRGLLRGCREQLDGHGAHAEQQLREHRGDEQETERVGDLAPWRRRAGTQQPATTDGCERDRGERRDDERDPVGTGGLDADDGEEGGEDNPERAFASQEDAVGAEAGVAGERTPGEELAEIRREPADQPRKQRRIALEDVLVKRAREHQRDHDQDHRQNAAEHCRAREDRASALVAHASR